jgi:membrane-associated phospholipid phosphatase
MGSRRVWVLLLGIWIVALVAAVELDLRVAQWVQAAPPIHRGGWLAWALKLPGYFPVTIGVAVLVGIFHRRSWRAALPLLLAGPAVGLVYTVLKWIVGRRRPVIPPLAPFQFHPFARGIGGLVHAESGLSFPSGHAAMAFATATCLAFALPRWAVVFYLIAAAVGAERVLENAHYLSDVVAGAGLGVACGWGAWKIIVGRVQITKFERRNANEESMTKFE